MLVDEFGHKANMGELIGNIVFYGASTRNQRAVDELNISDRVLCFVDRDKAKAGQKLGDYSIEPVEYLSQRDDIIVISVLVEHMTDVSVLLRTYGHKCLFYLSEQFNIEKVVRINWEILLTPAPARATAWIFFGSSISCVAALRTRMASASSSSSTSLYSLVK